MYMVHKIKCHILRFHKMFYPEEPYPEEQNLRNSYTKCCGEIIFIFLGTWSGDEGVKFYLISILIKTFDLFYFIYSR